MTYEPAYALFFNGDQLPDAIAQAGSYETTPIPGTLTVLVNADFAPDYIPDQSETKSITFGALLLTYTPTDAEVTVTDQYGKKVPATAPTLGTQTFILAEGDSYAYSVTAEGYYPQSGTFVYNGENAKTIDLERVTSDVIVKVLDVNGVPLENRTVTLAPPASAPLTATTDGAGLAYFLDVPVPVGGGFYAISSAADGVYQATSVNLYLEEPATYNATLTLKKQTGDAVVTVRDADDTTILIPNAAVWIDGEYKGVTNAMGVFTATDLEAGKTYSLLVSLNGYTYVGATSNQTIVMGGAGTVFLREIPVADNTIRVRAIDGGGAGVGGATVTLTGINGFSATAISDPNGYASFSVIDGTYSYLVTKNGYTGGTAQNTTVAAGQTRDVPFTLAENTYTVNFTFSGTFNGATPTIPTTDIELVGTAPGTYTGGNEGTFTDVPNGLHRFEFIYTGADAPWGTAVVFVNVDEADVVCNCFFQLRA